MRLMTAVIGMLCCFILQTAIHAQGLFESAGEDDAASGMGKEQAKSFSLIGYVKGSICGGQNDNNDAVISSGNAQAALKISAEKSGIGKAFSEIRLNAGKIRGSSSISCDVREAWASVSPGPFDIKLGRQILCWGRADAINPTNNITPKDETALSSEFDDTRLGNELLQMRAKKGHSSIQAIWIPYFRPDVLPLAGAEIPSGITIGEPVYPDILFSNGGFALRMELTHPSVDGSVSYFNGYATLPGFDFSVGQTGLSLIPRAYRIHAAGADFSTAIGSIGLRSEAAVKYPFEDYEKYVHVPNPYVQYVIGLDKSIADWSVLLQYSGLYVINYKNITEPVLTDPLDPMARALYTYALASTEIQRMNRLFTGTSDEISHSLMGNVQWNTLYETLHMKLAGMYNFTTKDFVINPSVSYDIADAVNLAAGGRYLDGPERNLNNMIGNLMSFVYTELKVSF
ncbi:MAG: hypothetical protein JW913_11245 [Chitinispirillaceae bacterium]|nr:hypothetical protein [Chitinispirillaceae bacterium]